MQGNIFQNTIIPSNEVRIECHWNIKNWKEMELRMNLSNIFECLDMHSKVSFPIPFLDRFWHLNAIQCVPSFWIITMVHSDFNIEFIFHSIKLFYSLVNTSRRGDTWSERINSTAEFSYNSKHFWFLIHHENLGPLFYAKIKRLSKHSEVKIIFL